MADTSDGECCKDPNFAVVCSFLERYNEILGLPEILYSDLQSYIEDTKSIHPALSDILVKLFRKAGRSHAKTENLERHIVKFCESYFCDMDAWEVETVGYRHAKISTKLKILKTLLEAQFDKNSKFKEKVNELFRPEELRMSPLGRDKDGLAYWYFMDSDVNLYIYREEQDDIAGETWELVCRTSDQLKTLIGDLKSTIEGNKDNKDETSESDEGQKSDQKKGSDEAENVSETKPELSESNKLDIAKENCTANCKVRIEKISPKLQNGLSEKLVMKTEPDNLCAENGIKSEKDSEEISENQTENIVKKDFEIKKEKDDCSEVNICSDKTIQDVDCHSQTKLENECIEKTEQNHVQTSVNSHINDSSEKVDSDVESSNLTGNTNNCCDKVITVCNEDKNCNRENKNKSIDVTEKSLEIKIEPVEPATECKDQEKSEPTQDINSKSPQIEKAKEEERSPSKSAEIEGSGSALSSGDKLTKLVEIIDDATEKTTIKKEVESSDGKDAVYDHGEETPMKKDAKSSLLNDCEEIDKCRETDGKNQQNSEKLPNDVTEPDKSKNMCKSKNNLNSGEKTNDKAETSSINEDNCEKEQSNNDVQEDKKEELQNNDSENKSEEKTVNENESPKEITEELPKTRPTRNLRKRPDPKPVSEPPPKENKQQKNNKERCESDSKKSKLDQSKNKVSEQNKNVNSKNNEQTAEVSKEKQSKAKKRPLVEEETSETTSNEPEGKKICRTRSSTRIKIRQMVEIQTALMAEQSSDDSDDVPLSKVKKSLQSKNPQIKKIKGKNNGRGTPSAEESPGTPQSQKREKLKKRKKVMMEHDEDFKPGKHRNNKKGKKIQQFEEYSSESFEFESDESGYEVGKIGRVVFPIDKKKKDHTEIDFDDVSSLSSNENDDDHDYKPRGRNARRAAALKERKKEEAEVSEEAPEDDTPCCKCLKHNQPELILLCDKCDAGFHTACLRPPLMMIPSGDWYCPPCEHKNLLEKLLEKLSLLEAQLKKKNRLKHRKERLAYVGVNLDNILKDERKSKVKQSEEDNSSVASSDTPYNRIYSKRSCRKRTTTNYNFDDYDELIDSAIKDEVDATAGGGGLGRGKDMANIYEADDKYSDRPSPVSKPKKKKKKSFKDLDVGSDTDDSDSYRATEDSVSEASQDQDENEVEEFSDEEWHPRYGFASRRSSRNRRFSSKYDDNFVVDEDESEDSDNKRRSNRSQRKRVSYRELGSDESTAESTPSSESDGYRPSKSKHKKTRNKKPKRTRRRYDSDSEPEVRTKRSRVKKSHKYESDSDYAHGKTPKYEESPARRKRASAAKVNFKSMLASDSEDVDNSDPKDSDYSQSESEEKVVSKKRNVINDSEESQSDYDSEKTENEEEPVKISRKRVIEDSDSDEDTIQDDSQNNSSSENEKEEENEKRGKHDVGKKIKKQTADEDDDDVDEDGETDHTDDESYSDEASSDGAKETDKRQRSEVAWEEKFNVTKKKVILKDKVKDESSCVKAEDDDNSKSIESSIKKSPVRGKIQSGEEVTSKDVSNQNTAECHSSDEVMKSPTRSDDGKSSSKMKQINGITEESVKQSKISFEDRGMKSPTRSNMQSPNRTSQPNMSPTYTRGQHNSDYFQSTSPPYNQGYYPQYPQPGQVPSNTSPSYPPLNQQGMYPHSASRGSHPPHIGNSHVQRPPFPPRDPGGPFSPQSQRGFLPRNPGEAFHSQNANKMPYPAGHLPGQYMPRGPGEMFRPRGPNISSPRQGFEEGEPSDSDRFSQSRRPCPKKEPGRSFPMLPRTSGSFQGQGPKYGAQLSPNDSSNETVDTPSGRGNFMMSNILRTSKTEEPEEDEEVSDIVKYVMQDEYFKK